MDVGASVKPISCQVGTLTSAPLILGSSMSMAGREEVGAGRAAGGGPTRFTRPSKDCTSIFYAMLSIVEGLSHAGREKGGQAEQLEEGPLNS